MKKLLLLLLLLPMLSFADNRPTELACVGNEKYVILCKKTNSQDCGIVSEEEKVTYVNFDDKSFDNLSFDRERICSIVVDDIRQEKRKVNFQSDWISLYSSFTSKKYKDEKESACYVHLNINRTSGNMEYEVTNFMHGLHWVGKASCSLKKNKF